MNIEQSDLALETSNVGIIDVCIDLFKRAREGLMVAAYALYKVRESKEWEGRYGSWNEFLIDLQIDAGQASRLCSVVEHYVIKNGVNLSQLKEINPERLYHAQRLPIKPEEQVLTASLLTVTELRAQLAMKGNDEHQCVAIQICNTCGKRM